MSGESPRELKLEVVGQSDGTVCAQERAGGGGAVTPTARRQMLMQQLAVGSPPGQQDLCDVPGCAPACAAQSEGIRVGSAAVVPAAAAA